MPLIERNELRTIDEIITIYRLEPQLRDIYVEGLSDKLLLEWFFKHFKCEPVTVFEIDSVNVPATLLTSHGLKPSNRNEVIVLSLEFQRYLAEDSKSLLCIADSDFDFLLGFKHNSRYLIYTDYTSADLYFCSEHCIEKFLVLGVHLTSCNPHSLFRNLVEVLRGIFLIRGSNEKLGWGLIWVDFIRCCKIINNLVVFDFENFIRKYLLANGRYKDIDEFMSTYNQLKVEGTKNYRQCVRGKDFLSLFGWYVSKTIGRSANKYRDSDIIRTAMVPSIDIESLANEEMFKKLLKIYGS